MMRDLRPVRVGGAGPGLGFFTCRRDSLVLKGVVPTLTRCSHLRS